MHFDDEADSVDAEAAKAFAASLEHAAQELAHQEPQPEPETEKKSQSDAPADTPSPPHIELPMQATEGSVLSDDLATERFGDAVHEATLQEHLREIAPDDAT